MQYIEGNPYPGDGLMIGHASHDGLKLAVMGKYGAQQYEPESGDEVAISISCKNGPYQGKTKLSGRFQDILYLEFDDLAGPSQGDINAIQISSDIADRVVDFVLKHRHRKKILVHCYAGMNRSRSTAAAIAEALGLPYIFTINNKEVYKAVLRAFRKR
jgi:predicted protein tyrosine phosphatase